MHGYSISQAALTANWEDMWEYLCDKTPLEGMFRARQIMQQAGKWNKDLIGAFLSEAQIQPEHKLVKVYHGVYRWDFGE